VFVAWPVRADLHDCTGGNGLDYHRYTAQGGVVVTGITIPNPINPTTWPTDLYQPCSWLTHVLALPGEKKQAVLF
jgi:hypothetical protein